MEKPLKKKRKPARPRQIYTLVLLAAALAAGAAFLYFAKDTGKVYDVPSASTYRRLSVREEEDVTRIAVTRREGEGYILLGENGRLSVENRPDFIMDSGMEAALLDACAILAVEDTVSESREEWEPHLADFGLASPAVTVNVTYSDGGRAAFSIGAKAPHNNWYYFMLEGDPGLYLAPADLINLFGQDVTAFHHIDQPVIHSKRIDSITIENAVGGLEAAFALETAITDSGALSAWRMTAPYTYPCDAAAMETLLSAMEKLYLGQFVSKATEEAKVKYGFSPPRRVITLHQAAGEIATIGESGAYEITPYPESTLAFALGAAQNDYVDYVEAGGAIYLVSSISQPLLNKLVPEKTLLMQPAAIAMETLRSLSVEKGGIRRNYSLRRVERLLPNNELATDEDGNVLTDTFVDLDGAIASLTEFESLITALQAVTVSGRLPEGFSPGSNLNIRLIFTFLDGRVRTLECVPFDALHDALGVDGTYLYYLPRGELDKGL